MSENHGDTPRITEKTCASCGKTKPAFKFKRLLTLAQTRARGGIGKRRMEVISKLCTECRALKAKPIGKLTAKELRNLNTDGVISDVELRVRLDKIKERAKTNMARGTAKAWDSRFVLAWSFYVDACEAELKRSQAALRHLRRDDNHPELLDFYTAYVHALRIAKFTMQSNARKRKPPTTHKPPLKKTPNKKPKDTLNPSANEIAQTHAPLACNYPRYIPDPVRRVLYSKWDGVPPMSRSSGRRVEPEAVFWREPEEAVIHPVSPNKTKGEVND